MSSVPSRGYEFNQDQNTLIADLAGRMRGVGFFLTVVGLLNLLAAALVIVTIYRAKLPQEYVDTVVAKVSEAAAKTDVTVQLSKLPPDNHLWGMAIGSAINGLLYVLIGAWTRNASSSFKSIVDTKGSDIGHLMEGLGSLSKMYQLIATLIVIGLLLFIATIGLFLYAQFTR
jgi:hypothetical protein